MASLRCARCSTELRTAALGPLCPACVRVEHDGIGTVRAQGLPAPPVPAEASVPPAAPAPAPGKSGDAERAALLSTLPSAERRSGEAPPMTLVSGGVEAELPMITSEVGGEWIPPMAPGSYGRASSGVPTTVPAGHSPLPARSRTVPLALAPPLAANAPAQPAYGPPHVAPYPANLHTLGGVPPQRIHRPGGTKTSATAVIMATLAVLAALAGTVWKLRGSSSSASAATGTAPGAGTPTAPPSEVVGRLHGLAADGHSDAVYMLIGDHVSRIERDSLAVRWSAAFPHVLGDAPGSLIVLAPAVGKSPTDEAGSRSARVVVVRDVHVRMYDGETGDEVGHFVRPEAVGTAPPSALCEAEGGEALVVYGTRTVAFHPTKPTATLLADAPSGRPRCEVPDAHCDVGVSCKIPAVVPRGLPAGCLAAAPAGRNVIAYCPTATVGRIILVDPTGKRLFEKEVVDLNSSKSFEFFSLRRDVLHLGSEGTLFTFDSADGTLLWSKSGNFRAGYRQMGRVYGEVDGRVVALDARTGQQLAVVGGR